MPESMLSSQTVGFPFEIDEIQLTTRLAEAILEFTICVKSLRAGNNFISAKDEALSCVSLIRLRYCDSHTNYHFNCCQCSRVFRKVSISNGYFESISHFFMLYLHLYIYFYIISYYLFIYI